MKYFFVSAVVFALTCSLTWSLETNRMKRETNTYKESNGQFSYTLYFDAPLSFINAFESCKMENSELISIDSVREFNFLDGFIRRSGIPNIRDQTLWTSGSDIYSEGNWIWMSNGAQVSRSYFGSGEPSGRVGDNEHCAHFWWPQTWDKFYLNDRACHLLGNYICKAKVNPR